MRTFQPSIRGPCTPCRTTPRAIAPTLPPCRHSPRWQCRAQADVEASSSDGEDAASTSAAAQDNATAQAAAALPKTGYFSLADPNQEVYSRAGERFDPMKKGGRFKPEFIWNTDWQKTLEMQESLERRREQALKAAEEAASNPQAKVVAGPEKGAVSFNRLAELDRMDVDLSEVLRRPAKPRIPTSGSATSASSNRQPAARASSSQPVARTVPLPRNDLRRLERSNRATKQMVTTVVSTKPEDEAAKAQQAAIELARYEQEKTEQRLWTAAFSVVGAAATYSTYGRETCISYVLGALAGYFYLRLLGRTVDGYAPQQSIGQSVGAVVGNQRLLIPVILALGYNRWNTLYADEYGLKLNLLAMLVGFLTYKIALVTRQGKQVLDEMSASNSQNK